MSVEIIKITPTIRARLEYDNEPGSPMDWDRFGEIAYSSRREILGTENVSRERLDEIAEGIESGTLIGFPVYAYVHSGVTISARPYSCPWDSGMSGFAYVTKAQAIKEFGRKIATQAVIKKAIKCLNGEVETFATYLEGDVYGIIIEEAVLDSDGDVTEWDELESCWGFYGYKYAEEEAKGMGAYWKAKREEEAAKQGETEHA